MNFTFYFLKCTWVFLLGVACGLTACGTPVGQGPTSPASLALTVPPTSRRTPPPSQTSAPTPLPATPVPSQTPTPKALICSPLEGIDAVDVGEAIVNPFNPPPPGSDDFHQGVDFGDLDPVSRIALSGRAVQAALAGRVAAIVPDRFPYGNAILIETPFDRLPPGWADLIGAPTPVASPVAVNLSCPDVTMSNWDASERSLYLLYAHLATAPEGEIDGFIDCGSKLGTVGDSGNALNPHLHLEARIGPSGASFPGLAHYDTGASPEEMAGYCAWRVEGEFVLLDPMKLFTLDG